MRAAVGHGQPVQPSALPAGAATNPDPEVFAYAAAQVSTRWRSPSGSAAPTTCCGAAARATTRCSTPTSSARATSSPASCTWSPSTSTEDRLRGHAPDRAEAAGADQAPVRLRRRRPCTASWRATASTSEYQAQYRGQPRDARRPQLPPRGRLRGRATASSAASTPTAAIRRTAGTPTSSRTRSTTVACHVRDPARRAASRPAASTSTPSCGARASTATDLFHAHIGGMDTLAHGAPGRGRHGRETASSRRSRDARYAGWNGQLGREILDGTASLEALADRVLAGEIDPRPVSGQQELYENIVNRHTWSVSAVDRPAR